MRGWLWPLALVVTFVVGWAVGGGLSSKAKSSAPGPDHQEVVVARLQQQVETLQARLRARDELAAARQARASADRGAAASFSSEGMTVPGVARSESAAPAPSAARVETSPAAARAGTATVQGALDRFSKYLETTRETNGPPRWREARELVEELRAMGPAAGQALMQVLASGNDSDERRSAARLLGQLKVAEALPMLREIVDRENDLLLRRAAASGLRQLQTPESIPVMERMLSQHGEDRYIRLSAAAGRAGSGRPRGITGLTQIFNEAAADGRGRELAFRALASLKDERPVPFMRQLLTAPVEPGYRLQAIRYLSAQGDQQALASLHVLMNSPTEQASIRDAAAQAYAVINKK